MWKRIHPAQWRGFVLEINRKPVKNSEEAVAMTENLKDESVLLRVWSRGGSRFVVLKKAEKVG